MRRWVLIASLLLLPLAVTVSADGGECQVFPKQDGVEVVLYSDGLRATPLVYLVGKELKMIKKAILGNMQVIDLRTRKPVTDLTFVGRLGSHKECVYGADIPDASKHNMNQHLSPNLLATSAIQARFEFEPSQSDQVKLSSESRHAELIATSDINRDGNAEFWFKEDKAFCVGEWSGPVSDVAGLREVNCVSLDGAWASK